MPEEQPKPAEQPVQLVVTPPDLHIANADALDSAKYRRARAMAAESGARLIIDPATPAPIVHEPGTIFIPRTAAPAAYKRLKERALAAGVPYAIQEDA
jgi:hypothetical protein